MMGPLFEKNLSMACGQTSCQKYWPKLIELVKTGGHSWSWVLKCKIEAFPLHNKIPINLPLCM